MNPIKRTLPPAASPIYAGDILNGIRGWMNGRHEVQSRIDEFKEFFNVKHCYLVSSGKAALTLILNAFKKKYPGKDTVLIPAFICYSVPSAIKRAGLKIAVCDINIESLDYDHTYLDQLFFSEKNNIQEKLLAVISPHLFGLAADVTKLRSIVGPNIPIIEDAAQAMGNYCIPERRKLIGDIAFFSFGRGKAISAVEGGAIITDDQELSKYLEYQINTLSCYSFSEKIILLFYSIALSFLLNPHLFWLPKMLPVLKLGETVYSLNFKIKLFSDFQAGLLRGWNQKLSQMAAKRAKNVKKLAAYFDQRRVASSNKEKHVYVDRRSANLPLLRFPVLMNSSRAKEKLIQDSETMGLGIMRTYPDIVPNIQELQLELQGSAPCKSAMEAVNRLLTMPVHQFVTNKDLINYRHLLRHFF